MCWGDDELWLWWSPWLVDSGVQDRGGFGFLVLLLRPKFPGSAAIELQPCSQCGACGRVRRKAAGALQPRPVPAPQGPHTLNSSDTLAPGGSR